jgi:WD40 repeat protein
MALSFVNGPADAAEPVAKRVTEFREEDDVASLAFSPDGMKLVTETFSKLQINIWDLKQTPRIGKSFLRPRGEVFTSTNGIQYSPDGRYMAIVHPPNDEERGYSVVGLFDADSGKHIRGISEPIGGNAYTRIAYVPDGSLLVRTNDSLSPAGREQFLVYRSDTLERVWGLQTAPLSPCALAVSTDGKFAAIGGVINGPNPVSQIAIVDITSRNVVKTLTVPPWQFGAEQVAWHPGGHYVAAGGSVGVGILDSIQVFDATSGAVVASEAVGSSHLQTLRYSPDGKYLVECGLPRSVRIWDGMHQILLQQIPAEDCYALAISRDGKQMALSDRQRVSIWRFQ